MFYQDEGVDTSLLAAEAGCACSESWKGGNEICLKFINIPMNLLEIAFLFL